MKRQITNQECLSGAELTSLKFTNDESAILSLKSLENCVYTVTFTNTLQVKYRHSSNVNCIYEVNGDDTDVKQMISRLFVNPIPEHSYRKYQIVDMNDCPFLEVVAENVSVEKKL